MNNSHQTGSSADSAIPGGPLQELLLDAARVPQYLKSWLSWTATWQTFSFEFLKAWGGRWAPGLQRGNDGNGAWWLWVTSIYIHQNLQHIVSNLLLFIAMSVHLELNYGWWRLLLVWFTSGTSPAAPMPQAPPPLPRHPGVVPDARPFFRRVETIRYPRQRRGGHLPVGGGGWGVRFPVCVAAGTARFLSSVEGTRRCRLPHYRVAAAAAMPGRRHRAPLPRPHRSAGIGANLVSAAFEKSCTLLVGASGAVFGFMGLFVADLVINFESISWPFLRILIILLFVIFFVVNAIIDDSPQRVSHASHLGGLVCGLFPSLLFLPNLRNKRLKALQRQITEGGGPAEGATTKCAPGLPHTVLASVALLHRSPCEAVSHTCMGSMRVRTGTTASRLAGAGPA